MPRSHSSARARAQLDHELAVIERVGLSGYFIVVWDIVRFARDRGIRCQGRGSAANSLVAYLLGITPVDPLAHNLLFERFLSEDARPTRRTPDIDVDFAADRREEVIQYVYERYGEAHVGMVCNIVTYRARSALRDAAKALAFPPDVIDRAAKALDTHSAEVAAGRSRRCEDGSGQCPSEPGTRVRRSALGRAGRGAGTNGGRPAPPLDPRGRHADHRCASRRDRSPGAGGHASRSGGAASRGRTVGQGQRRGRRLDKDRSPFPAHAGRGRGGPGSRPRAVGRAARPGSPAAGRPTPSTICCERADTIGCFQVESRAQAQMLPRLAAHLFRGPGDRGGLGASRTRSRATWSTPT